MAQEGAVGLWRPNDLVVAALVDLAVTVVVGAIADFGAEFAARFGPPVSGVRDSNDGGIVLEEVERDLGVASESREERDARSERRRASRHR